MHPSYPKMGKQCGSLVAVLLKGIRPLRLGDLSWPLKSCKSRGTRNVQKPVGADPTGNQAITPFKKSNGFGCVGVSVHLVVKPVPL
jgi:hypothetical protein